MGNNTLSCLKNNISAICVALGFLLFYSNFAHQKYFTSLKYWLYANENTYFMHIIPRRRSLPKTPCRSKAARIRTSSAAQCKATRSRQRSAAISTLRPCRKKKPTRRRTHRQASISRGIFARENSPSPRSAFQRAEERSTPTIEAQEASPVSSLEKAASTSTSKRTPTSRAPSLQARRMRERTAYRLGRSLSAIWGTVRTTARKA